MSKRQSHSSSSNFAALLQEFFVERLMQQRAVSPQTIASYRDTFRLFLQFAQARLHKSPVDLALADINVDLVLAFLRHLEDNRHNCARTRNSRLVAIRSFLKYATLKDISSLAVIQSTLAIPMKRCDRPLIGHLSRDEIEALLAAPDPNTWCGQRDRVLFATLYNTGARVSELIGLRVGDVVLDKAPCAHIHGKGGKQRTVPLWRSTASQIRSWLPQIRSSADQILFPNRSGNPMTRSNVTDRLKLAARTATRQCPQLSSHPISPHVIRHSTGTHLLQSGVDLCVITVAWTRKPSHYSHVRRSRSRDEGACAQYFAATSQQNHAVSTARSLDAIPGKLVIMRSSHHGSVIHSPSQKNELASVARN